MLGQGHKIILTMSRWPNCPNMCGANEVPSMRCQMCGAVVPGLVGFPMWCQMCGVRIPLKLEVTEVKVK